MKAVLLVIGVLFISLVGAVDCPLGLVNDSYPGDCGLYTDTNHNKICDLSEEEIIQPELEKAQTRSTKEYYFIPILVVSVLVYLGSYFYFRKRVVLHRKIWNVLLLVSFLAMAISGILLVLRLNLGISIPSSAFF